MQRPRTSVPTAQRLIRGVRNENGDAISHPGSARPATPGKNVLARPPSSLAAFSHVHRIGTIASGSYGTVGGGERPITQYGVAGMRPGTGRGMMRQIQDKRYYLSLLQLKIRDLGQEITAILRDVEAQSKERAKFLHYDKLAKDLAVELTNLQSELADYNTVVDKLTSDVSKSEIERETFELAAKNQSSQLKIEEMLEERLKIQEKARQISQTFESQTRDSANVVSNMAAADRAKFEALQAKKRNLNAKLSESQAKLDELNSIEENLEREIGASELKQETAKLELKLIELQERKAKLLREQRDEISPEEEKEKILGKVRAENSQIAAAEAQLNETRKRIQDGERLLERLQLESEENESEKRLKFKELKKREFMIEDFMANFEVNKENERKKLEKLENSVVESLSKMSENPLLLSNNENSINFDENAILSKSSDIFSDNENNEIEKLEKLRQIKMEMEILESRIENELKELKIDDLASLDNFEVDSREKEAKLKLENEELKNRQEKIEEELKEIKIEFEDRKMAANNNDLIREINELQVREENLRNERKMAENFIEKEKNWGNFANAKKNALKSVEFYNNSLKESLKNVFVN